MILLDGVVDAVIFGLTTVVVDAAIHLIGFVVVAVEDLIIVLMILY